MNKFGKPVLVILIILGLGYASHAQRNNLRMQNFNRATPITTPVNDNVPSEPQVKRIQAIKEKFMVIELNLPPDQANKFLKVYRAWQNDMAETRRLKRLNNSPGQNSGSQQLDKDLSYDRKLIDIKEHYQNEFLKILSPEKVSKLYKSEQEFKDELFKNLNERN